MQTKHDFHRDNGSQPTAVDVFRGRQKTTLDLGLGTQRVVQEDGTNYILIVNQHSQQATRAQIPTAEMLLKSTKSSPQFVLTENKNKLSGENATITPDKFCPAEFKVQSKTISRCKGHVGNNIKEHLKINFSNLGFDEYDSTASSFNVFKDESEEKECSTVAQSSDEGYSESNMNIENFVKQHYKGLNLNDTQEMKSPYNVSRTTYTPSCNIDLSASSGYQSAGGSSWLTSPTPSDLASPSPNNAARQVILISPGPTRTLGVSKNSAVVSSRVASNCSIASPVSSLACNLQGTAFFQSPAGVSPVLSNIQHDLGKPLSSSTPVETKSISVSGINTSTGASSFPNTTDTIQKLMQAKTSMHSLTSKASAAKCLKSMNIVLPNLSQIPKTNTKMTITEKGIKQELPEPPDPQAGEVVIHINIKEQQAVVKMECDRSRPTTPHHLTDPLSPDMSNTPDCLNNSLTNMHWLKGIQGINESVQSSPKPVPTLVETPKGVASNPLQWRCLSTSDVEKIARECGRHKRPPFSYMTLIQMGLNSREDKRMTLREICHWIEDTFPYYKHTAKPGWKNSIRHNLSLYSIFEREKSKKHGSHWTIRDDCPEKSKSVPAKDGLRKGPLGIGTMLPVSLPTFLQQSHGLKVALPPNTVLGDRSKKGPQPILPRPMAVSQTPLQTYALIPIQNMGQGLQQGIQIPSTSQGQPMLIQLPKSGQSLSQHSNPGSPLLSPLVQNIEEKPLCTRLKKKQRYSAIAPKEVSTSTPSPKHSISIVRQAWIDSQNNSTSDDSDTTRLGDSKCIHSSQGQTGAKKAKLRAGLPKPKIYMRTTPPSRKGKARRKQKLVPKERELMAESSEEDLENLEQEDPLTSVLPSSGSTTVSTSTPLKVCGFPSPQMPSPIIGLTPLRSSGLLDSSFLDCLKDSDSESKGFLISPDIRCAKKLSLGQNRTPPNSSVLDLNFSFSQTPLRCDPGTDFGGGDHNQSLSKFLAEFPIDTNMMEDGLPVDISSLNWSVGEQDQSPLSNS
ncbi:uncharacterized protein LOC110465629 [Mizuhopecten yessoensis]|uniref:Forkhead box protein M1 n=1 Tax=Mizuhopecten yessoensis TaxID=6573 RepID=A0A210R228_MIZYE|nr:uncharacterized protein LOC110465629 [Mizuhopecten yessoensis]OWF54986.1 Forkhead box protein M1 [Mizuhopecten yessoensis]